VGLKTNWFSFDLWWWCWSRVTQNNFRAQISQALYHYIPRCQLFGIGKGTIAITNGSEIQKKKVKKLGFNRWELWVLQRVFNMHGLILLYASENIKYRKSRGSLGPSFQLLALWACQVPQPTCCIMVGQPDYLRACLTSDFGTQGCIRQTNIQTEGQQFSRIRIYHGQCI